MGKNNSAMENVYTQFVTLQGFSMKKSVDLNSLLPYCNQYHILKFHSFF